MPGCAPRNPSPTSCAWKFPAPVWCSMLSASGPARFPKRNLLPIPWSEIVLRAILIYLSKARWSRRLVTGWQFARRAAIRFVAGDTLEEALGAIRRLNAIGLSATLGHLGGNGPNHTNASR